VVRASPNRTATPKRPKGRERKANDTREHFDSFCFSEVDGADTLTITGSTISLNTVSNLPGGAQGLGGGVYVENTTNATINQTDITDNTASWQGGGLYVLNTSLTMTGGQLAGNTSAQSGGGFFIDATGFTVTLNQVSVTNNTATNGLGGGGYVAAGTLAGQLLAGQLTGNTAGGQGPNGSLPGIGLGIDAFWTITVAPNQQQVEVNQ
jgi:hypothetical protein